MHLPSWLLLFLVFVLRTCGIEFTDELIKGYREKVRRMFYHAYNGYLENAYPLDELKPISCVGQDTWGSFSLSLVDALDTLLVMGNHTEFVRALDLVLKSVQTDANVNVSVFETNIRVVGGLLSAHMLSGRVPGIELEEGWPCSGPLLRLAERMASKLLPAFNTDTGMPFGTVNLKYGVHKAETPITCTAGVGTFIIEFGTLSRLTGDPVYEHVALRALDALWNTRSSIGLVGNHINVQTGQWTATDAGIGAGVDSYFEYLVKGAYLLQKPQLMKQFREYATAINRHVRKEDWFMWVSMQKGTVSLPIFQSLEAFWPGVLTMIGDVEDASRIMLQYSQTIRQFGFPPEFYNIYDRDAHDKRAAYPLRPEIAESLMYLYRATRDPVFLEIGAIMIDAIEHSAKTNCGYATINNVKEHSIEDRMESFFLAETTKYLYLLFDPGNFLHNDGTSARIIDTPNGECVIEAGGYIYNTEAHPIDPGIVHCCSHAKAQERRNLRNWESSVDFLSLIDAPYRKGEKLSKEVHELEEERDENDQEETESWEDNDNTVMPSPHAVSITAPRSDPPEAESHTLLDKDEVFKQVRKLIRKSRIMDEERKEQGQKADITENLLRKLQDLEAEYGETIRRAKLLADMDFIEIKRLMDKRATVAALPVANADCVDCCYPLERIGDSIGLRILQSIIYQFHLYPANNISFEFGPVCRAREEPRIEDSYMSDIPKILNISSQEGYQEFSGQYAYTDFVIYDDLRGCELLLSPPLGFDYKLIGLGQVLPRRNSSWYYEA